MEIEVHPLVPDPVLPTSAPASTRTHVPRGYGVQEQCLPFTAAASAGLLIHSPFSFGFCAPADVPDGGRAFAPPLRSDAHDAGYVFYVQDRPSSRFAGNAFRVTPIPYVDPKGQPHLHHAVHPGLSFFDRPDQAGLFKLHLPYVLRTPEGVDSLFMAPMNRPGPCALFKAWSRRTGTPIRSTWLRICRWTNHCTWPRETPWRQVVFLHRTTRAADVSVVLPGSAASQTLQRDLLRWYVDHNQDRSSYKKLARSRHGRLDSSGDGQESHAERVRRGSSWVVRGSVGRTQCVHSAGVVFDHGDGVEACDLQRLPGGHGAQHQRRIGNLLFDLHACCCYVRRAGPWSKRDDELKAGVGIVPAQLFELPAKVTVELFGHDGPPCLLMRSVRIVAAGR